LELLQILGEFVDLFLYDLKLMDSQKHQAVTGVPNELILANLSWLAEQHPRVIVRVPIIPGINDDQETLRQIGEFMVALKQVPELHLLPYHKAGSDKYRRLGRTYQLSDLQAPDTARMEQIAGQLEQFGLKIKIGG
jgi:pyruvate formate lyase activating enzyme